MQSPTCTLPTKYFSKKTLMLITASSVLCYVLRINTARFNYLMNVVIFSLKQS